MVHTTPKGIEYHNSMPYERAPYDENAYVKNADKFAAALEKRIRSGYFVSVADISFVNGADNFLLRNMQKRGLLYKVKGYSGWNTPTNSTGFAIGMGMLALHMNQTALNRSLTMRYLDDWAYQANVRTTLADQLFNMPDNGASYYSLKGDVTVAENRVTDLMQNFAMNNLPPFDFLQDFSVKLPWRRMFECEVRFMR